MSSETSPFGAEYSCVDDLMQAVISDILAKGGWFSASKGDGKELLGVNLRLTNPRARLSRSEMRGKVFSGLGELLWYLSGSDELAFIRHYIPVYDEMSDDKATVHGAYGPRLFGANGGNQVQNVIRLLQSRRTSRRAAIQVFSANDLKEEYADVPCTCTMQAILRNDLLNLVVYMRSNDAYWGLPHDIFAFTMLQEMMARALGVDVGFYQHMVGSIHLYEGKFTSAEQYLAEKYQTIEPMPAMPMNDPWESLLRTLLRAESSIRRNPQATVESKLDPYWEDVIRLLRVHSEKSHKHAGYVRRISGIKTEMHSAWVSGGAPPANIAIPGEMMPDDCQPWARRFHPTGEVL